MTPQTRTLGGQRCRSLGFALARDKIDTFIVGTSTTCAGAWQYTPTGRQHMDRTIRTRDSARAWQAQHEPHAPSPGDVAPDFELADATGANPVRLSSLRGRPVALVFGSFT